MSRPQELVEDQVELEEEIISGNGEADEVMDEIEEGYSRFHAVALPRTHCTHVFTSIFYPYFHAHVD